MADPVDKRYAAWKRPLLKEASGVVIDLGKQATPNARTL